VPVGFGASGDYEFNCEFTLVDYPDVKPFKMPLSVQIFDLFEEEPITGV